MEKDGSRDVTLRATMFPLNRHDPFRAFDVVTSLTSKQPRKEIKVGDIVSMMVKEAGTKRREDFEVTAEKYEDDQRQWTYELKRTSTGAAHSESVAEDKLTLVG